jgi:hypothetical protein
MGNACYHSVQNLLSTCLLSTNNKIKICKTTICLLFYKGVTSASLILRVLRRAEEDIGNEREKQQEAGEDCTGDEREK